MATIFKDVVGRDGCVCRQGGDEFLIIARTASRKQLVNIVERIYASIERAEGFAKNIEKILGKKVRITKEHSISCSIGIATAKDFRGEKTIARLIRKADDALYHVKADGKGKYEFS